MGTEIFVTILGFLYIGCILAVLIFVLWMLYRFVVAHEQIARHLFEIAKDHKTSTLHQLEKDKR